MVAGLRGLGAAAARGESRAAGSRPSAASRAAWSRAWSPPGPVSRAGEEERRGEEGAKTVLQQKHVYAAVTMLLEVE